MSKEKNILKNVLKMFLVIALVVSLFQIYSYEVKKFEREYKEDLELYNYCMTIEPEKALQDDDCHKFSYKISEQQVETKNN